MELWTVFGKSLQIVSSNTNFLSETAVELLQELNADISKETKIIAPEIRMLDQIVDH